MTIRGERAGSIPGTMTGMEGTLSAGRRRPVHRHEAPGNGAPEPTAG
jgi:hypothetical protein